MRINSIIRGAALEIGVSELFKAQIILKTNKKKDNFGILEQFHL